jgi:hypothetical protein
MIVNGEICARCMLPFTKAHDYPVICPSCYEPGAEYQKAIFPVER